MTLARRSVVAAIGLAAAGGLAYTATAGFRTDTTVETLRSAPVTFGEWELFVLDARNAAILVLDPMTETLLARWSVTGGATGLLQSLNARMAVAVDAGDRVLTIVRQRANFERLTIALDLEPSIVALSPDGALFAILDRPNGELAFVATEDGRLIGRARGVAGAETLLFSKYGDTLYVTARNSPAITRFDPVAAGARAPVVVDGLDGIERMLPVRGEDRAIVVPTAASPQNLKLVDLASGTSERTFGLASTVSSVAVDQGGTWLFAASASRPEIYRLSVWGEYRATIASDGIADNLVIGGLGKWLGVTQAETTAISVFDTADNARIQRWLLPSASSEIFYHVWSRKLFVTLEDDQSLWLMDTDFHVRRMALRGSAPSLIARPGSAICHA